MLLYCSKELFDSSIVEVKRRKSKSCKRILFTQHRSARWRWIRKGQTSQI